MSEPIQLNIYFNHQNYPLETFADESLETLSAQIESITNIQSCYQTLLIETYYLPLDMTQQLSTYHIKSGQTIVVLGSNKVAADPKQKLSEVQLEKIQESYFSKHPLGLENQLNFCYLISSVQALFSLKPVQAQVNEKLISEEPHLLKLKELFTGLQEKTNPKITAFSVPFVKKFEQFQNVKEQHDAQEALSCLETNLVQNGVENMFEVITDKETMQFLPLQIKPEFTSVNDSVQNLLGDSKIVKLPKILQMHLLRYAFDEETKKPQKLSRKLQFQIKMVLNEFLASPQESKTYNLKAVIAHQGLSPDSGHYTCYARHGKKWFCFNDASVQVVEEEAVYALAGGDSMGFLAYVLIYEAE
ncbi:Ubiquitin_carboxyl-terminal hydrolase family protein [Hexamita inflata]|uniref:Ubiquitin carboxyl-terminal hydrolase family protein n=1 Tax=Hexamita inflata TaxID=28002 RepID=A0AA86PD48_9EUKA|nr:Ubiquitin carboxyl-terminal hydrolase family protein [Hexamita inflata]